MSALQTVGCLCVIALVLFVLLWSCLVVAGRYDEQSEREWRQRHGELPDDEL